MSNVRRALLLLLLVAIVATPVAAGPFDWLGGFFKNPFAVAPCGGFQLLSATPISITSTENLSGQYTTLQIIANCAGESATLIQRDQLSSFLKLPIGTEIQIGLQSTAETNTYPILNEGIPVYSYASQYAQCASMGNNGCLVWSNYQQGATYTWQTACGSVAFLTRTRIGTLGSLGAPMPRAFAILTVAVGNKTTETKVGSQDPSVVLETPEGEEIGSATWLGGLVSYQTLPSESNYGAFYDEAKKAWKVTTSAEKDTYRISQATVTAALAAVPTAGFCFSQLFSPNEAINTASLTTAAAAALQGSTATLGASPIKNADSLTTAAAPFEIQALINKPIILLTIRADLLNIVMPSSKPAIQSASISPFGVGEFSALAVNVVNEGGQQGGFAVSATCGQLLVSPGQTITLQPGQAAPVQFQVTASAAQSGTCEVKACDVAGGGCATATTTYKVTPTKICIPGEVKPDVVSGAMGLLSASGGTPFFGTSLTAGEIVLTQCSADGMNSSVVLACAAGGLVYEPNAKPYPWACSELAKCGAPVEIFSKYTLEEAKPGCTSNATKTITGVTEKYIGATSASAAGQGFIEATWQSAEPVTVESTACFNVVAKPESWSFLDAASGCTYLCQAQFGEGTLNPPTGQKAFLMGCGQAATKAVTAIKSSGVVAPPPLKTPPPVKNQTGASTAGMCKVDNDCLYVGEKCVTGACQKTEGVAGLPGFEAVFAVAGLLSVAWLVNRKQRGR